MSVRVSGKHMEIGDSFRQRIEDQIGEAVTKYFDGGYSGQVIVEKAGSRFSADCKVHLDTGIVLHAAGEANDPQISFDAAAQRIEKRLRRYKRRLKDHHAGNHVNGYAEVAYTVMDSVPDEGEEVPEDFAPTIVAESSKQLKTMTVASAVMALDMTDEPVLLFRSPGKEHLNIVYRRNDGNIGWIDSTNIKN
ncbi:Sigma 54 modulation protein/ribosomal protein S30EA [Neorhizobium galegae bv. officinalis bv. officinalis str. HAMBI 1141]|uniref:Ribosome hibernation promoting factor n=1 Tax=Neorhizobium galegae bv. officinalis bv. officinalis str. HAMBI 1141 TaxID=1028801 RepID=A0A068T2W3_NEOGA|nr:MULTISPECIES: ribosome-associated translation inhibitor RaiA [Neorhizobium]MCJ9668868.1 ribosome-associated translation inhibitor RaiA [Neorhizobium sp. SHOUNA12B]MCJ9743381.1 ribosome-associated translation inhibitor RaiA [Neorhizobium sp. SHOUNA12A]MCJ9750550.1 ribosome-associated translation inhibitor RaiA [Neorhizobium sp. BETTINA12A]CDN52379.1 Sigma 54 modulation protein/ribosomal protein S30EA [Neorhizobium galegae bv. officinalis bv. officinalis str. HAMBI 1141]